MEERVEQLKNSLQTAGVYASRIADYFGVSIEHDGKGFVIEGETKDVLTARDVFVALDKLSSDSEIDETDISYLLNIAGEGRLEEFLKTSDEVFYMTPSGRAIKPRTLGQRLYVDSLKKTELVICCGPAGTGKTFLGVAMAVKASKSREVSKIILTRPAIEAGERLGFLPGDIEEKVNPYMRPIYALFPRSWGRRCSNVITIRELSKYLLSHSCEEEISMTASCFLMKRRIRHLNR